MRYALLLLCFGTSALLGQVPAKSTGVYGELPLKARELHLLESASELGLFEVGVGRCRIQAVAVSGGKMALTAVLSGGSYMAQGHARLDLGIVDGSSGDVDAYFASALPATMKRLTKKQDALMAKVAGRALKRYPERGLALDPRGEIEPIDEGPLAWLHDGVPRGTAR